MKALVMTFEARVFGLPHKIWVTVRMHDELSHGLDEQYHITEDDALLHHLWCVARAKHRIGLK